jgi:hypothetical protein
VLPLPSERQPGNAAIDYLRALLLLPSPSQDKGMAQRRQEQLDAWLTIPLDRLPLAQVESYIEPYTAALRALELGARRQYCQWQLEDHLRQEDMSILLEECGRYRHLLAIVRLRMRYHLARSDIQTAWRDWQTGWQFGRDVAQSPTLIRMLVGIALLSQMLDSTHDWIQLPQGFNLREALLTLPQPLFDPSFALDGEAAFIRSSLPQPMGLEDKVLPTTEALRQLQQSYRIITQKQPMGALFLATYAAQCGPAARAELLRLGQPRDFVERISDAQAVALRNSLYMRALWHSWRRLFHSSYIAGQTERQRLQQQIQKLQKSDDVVLRLLGLSMVSVARSELAFHQLQRRRAALLAIETLRLHAMQRKQLPESIDTLSDLPIDPATGRPFLYQRTSQGFRITVPSVTNNPQADLIYEFTIRQTQ